MYILPVILGLIASFIGVFSTPLDDYVWKPDENYNWVDLGPDYVLRESIFGKPYTAYTINMTSQRWLTDDDFSPSSDAKSIWWHYVVVIVPDNLKFKNNASLWITGGNMGMGKPDPSSEDILISAALAVNTGTITGIIFQIPNEHVTFSSDPIQKSRTEDAIIAFTWAHFLDDPSNPEWLVRFPMVKASVRAMDAVTDFVATKLPELGCQLDYYVVTGASKRGWTTWLVGAVDPKRVVAIVPIVLDAINFVTVEHHQYRSYGGWSYALVDYTDMNITMRFDEPNMKTISEYEDPYFYASRLTMPKLVINAAMDEFQQPDDTHYWWSDMPEPKHFLIAPNAEHSMATGIFVAVPAAAAWISNLLYKDTIPTFTWNIDDTTGEITATLDNNGIVHSANVWWAYSCGENAFDNNTKRRDYRVAHLDNPCSCGIYAAGYCANLKSLWDKKELESTTVKGKRVFTAKFDAPTDGSYVAFFIDFKFKNSHAHEMKYDYEEILKHLNIRAKKDESLKRILDNFGGFPHDFGGFFEFTTEVSIFPNTFPYEDCVGAACGTLLL